MKTVKYRCFEIVTTYDPAEEMPIALVIYYTNGDTLKSTNHVFESREDAINHAVELIDNYYSMKPE